MIKRVGVAPIGVVLVLLVFVIGVTPAWAGRLAGGGFGTSAVSFELLQPGTPNDLSATAVSSSEIDLSWAAPIDGLPPGGGYNVYDGTSSGGESSTPVNPAPVTDTTFAATGLSGSTTYYFEVTAVDAASNESDFSIEASATTFFSVPLGPSALSATAVSSSEVDLSWTAPSGGLPPSAGYNVYEGASTGGESSTPINSTLVTDTTFAVTGLSDSTTYYFVVIAVGCRCKPDISNEASATTLAVVPTGPPRPPTGLSATGVSRSEVDLSWSPAGSGSPPVGYYLYEATSAGGESTTAVNSTPVTRTSFSATGLSAGTTYYFVVTAVDAAGNESDVSNEASGTTFAAAPPVPHPRPSATLVLIIVALAFIGGVIAGALLMMTRRRLRSAKLAGAVGAAEPVVRVVPHGQPLSATIQASATKPTFTVHIQPYPSAGITTIEEVLPR